MNNNFTTYLNLLSADLLHPHEVGRHRLLGLTRQLGQLFLLLASTTALATARLRRLLPLRLLSLLLGLLLALALLLLLVARQELFIAGVGT